MGRPASTIRDDCSDAASVAARPPAPQGNAGIGPSPVEHSRHHKGAAGDGVVPSLLDPRSRPCVHNSRFRARPTMAAALTLPSSARKGMIGMRTCGQAWGRSASGNQGCRVRRTQGVGPSERSASGWSSTQRTSSASPAGARVSMGRPARPCPAGLACFVASSEWRSTPGCGGSGQVQRPVLWTFVNETLRRVDVGWPGQSGSARALLPLAGGRLTPGGVQPFRPGRVRC